MKGKAYLVGAGPGDPGLLTVKGLRRLQSADTILYDDLANPDLLKHAKPGAKLIFVGAVKGPAHGRRRMERLLRILKRETEMGRQVVRLKGGDPFLFGRGGEETAFLKKSRIPFEVIPGVSSALAVPACAGIPLTLRGTAAMVTIVTGHECLPNQVDWARISPRSTLVILMGLARIREIMETLLGYGWNPRTKAVVLSRGTLPDQKQIIGTIKTIAGLTRRSRIKRPAVIVVGEVVGFYKSQK